MFCAQCGISQLDDVKFCESCGAPAANTVETVGGAQADYDANRNADNTARFWTTRPATLSIGVTATALVLAVILQFVTHNVWTKWQLVCAMARIGLLARGPTYWSIYFTFVLLVMAVGALPLAHLLHVLGRRAD